MEPRWGPVTPEHAATTARSQGSALPPPALSNINVNDAEVRAVIATRGNAADNPDGYFRVRLPVLYAAICGGAIGHWPQDRTQCCECSNPNQSAVKRERRCIQHVDNLTAPGAANLAFHHAVCVAAYTAEDHGMKDARPRKLHHFLNGALYDSYSDDAELRAAAIDAKAHMGNLIACLRDAVDAVARDNNADLPQRIAVYRGVDVSSQQALARLEVGEVRVFPPFLSTSVEREPAVRFATRAGTLLRFNVPSTMAARIWRWSTVPKECEVLIKCGVIARVSGIAEHLVNSDTPLTIDLEILGALNDDGSVPKQFWPRPPGASSDGGSDDTSCDEDGDGSGSDGGDSGPGNPAVEPGRFPAPEWLHQAAMARVGTVRTGGAVAVPLSGRADDHGAERCEGDVVPTDRAPESVDLRTFESLAEHWQAPCKFARDNPVGVSISAFASSAIEEGSVGDDANSHFTSNVEATTAATTAAAGETRATNTHTSGVRRVMHAATTPEDTVPGDRADTAIVGARVALVARDHAGLRDWSSVTSHSAFSNPSRSDHYVTPANNRSTPLPTAGRPTAVFGEPQWATLRTILTELDAHLRANVPDLVDIRDVTPYHSSSVPPMPLADYAHRICAHAGYGPVALTIAFALLARRSAAGRPLCALSMHRALLTCIVVGAKAHFDNFIRNDYMAAMGGVEKSELNRLEATLLTEIDWRLTITTEEWVATEHAAAFVSRLLRSCGARLAKEYTF